MELSFTVDGDPKPQGSKRGFVTKTGKVAMVEMAGKPLKDWRETVTAVAAKAAHDADWMTTLSPVGVLVEFRIRQPKKPTYSYPPRPDVDKMQRALLDALTYAGLWKDDSQVMTITAIKSYSDQPGATVNVWTIY